MSAPRTAPINTLTRAERERLILSVKGLVRKFARRDDDVAQELWIAVMRAAETFDAARGAFTSHAVWAMRACLEHAARRKRALRRAGDATAISLDAPAHDEGTDTLHDVTPAPSSWERVDAKIEAHQHLALLAARLQLAGHGPDYLRGLVDAAGCVDEPAADVLRMTGLGTSGAWMRRRALARAVAGEVQPSRRTPVPRDAVEPRRPLCGTCRRTCICDRDRARAKAATTGWAAPKCGKCRRICICDRIETREDHVLT